MHYKWTLHSRTSKQVKHLWFAKLRIFYEFFFNGKKIRKIRYILRMNKIRKIRILDLCVRARDWEETETLTSRDRDETFVALKTWSRPLKHKFLPRCIECRGGLAMRKLSVSSSVCQTRDLSHAFDKIVTKRKNDLSRFLYHTKEHLA